MSNENGKSKKERVRSSPYPYYDLEKSLDFVEKIYNQVKLYDVHVDAAIEAMGLSTKSSAGNRAVSSLTLFGLLEQSGQGEDRKVKLTSLAQEIILSRNRYGGKGDKALLRRAALTPNMISHIWGLYSEQGLPNDKVMEMQLLKDNQVIVSNVAVDRIISVTRDSLAYAEVTAEGVDSDDALPENEEEQGEPNDNGSSEMQYQSAPPPSTPPPPTGKQLQDGTFKVYTHPFTSGDVTLTIPVNITPEEMELLQEWIGFMKKTMRR